jgi:meso-butanediol dehydrogenase/(S,S)-butanediol dehydrogenase/diacetyl reductase
MTADLQSLPLLKDQVAIVTGSAQGIGAGIATALGRFGAQVVIADLNADKAEEQAKTLTNAGIRAIGLAHDVTSATSSDALAERVKAELGRIDVLVNNAGISGRTPLVEMSDGTWDSMINVNLTGVHRTTRAVARVMKAQGSGNIINVSSVAGRAGKANMTHYCATKFGVIGFSQSLALELAAHGIRVNAVCPGIVRTALWEVELEEISQARDITIEEAWDDVLAGIPLNRPQTPEDIGNAAAFLASPLAANITGQALNVCGGFELS